MENTNTNTNDIKVGMVMQEIGRLYDMYKVGTLILQPAYQRKYVMEKATETQDSLIQSILANPNHYVAFVVLRLRDDGIIEVLDGQQRLQMYFNYLDAIVGSSAYYKLREYLQRCDIISCTYPEAIDIFTNLQKSKPLKKSEIAKNNVPANCLESLAKLDNSPVFLHTFGKNLNYLSRECMAQIILVAESTDKKVDIDGNASSTMQADFSIEDMDYISFIADFLQTDKKKTWHKKSYLPVIFPIAQMARDSGWKEIQFVGFLNTLFGKSEDVPAQWKGYRKDFTDFAGSNSASASHVQGRYNALFFAFSTAIANDFTPVIKEATTSKAQETITQLQAEKEAQDKLIAKLLFKVEQVAPTPLQGGLNLEQTSDTVKEFSNLVQEVEAQDLVLAGKAVSSMENTVKQGKQGNKNNKRK